MKRYKLNSAKTEVNFDFGGNLQKWQIKQICQEYGNDYDALKNYLLSNPEDGWTDEGVDEFISFLESEDIKLMFPEFYE
jgi:SPX domain protein involved in polyphosphate accumulation